MSKQLKRQICLNELGKLVSIGHELEVKVINDNDDTIVFLTPHSEEAYNEILTTQMEVRGNQGIWFDTESGANGEMVWYLDWSLEDE